MTLSSSDIAVEKSLEQRRKDMVINSIKSRAIVAAQQVKNMPKATISLKDAEKIIQKARAHVLADHKQLFDETVHEELKDFISSFFI